MLHKLRFNKDFRCYKQGDEISFRSGINLLVGDQGCGKSSLLQAIQMYQRSNRKPGDSWNTDLLEVWVSGSTKSYSMDFEKDNPRINKIGLSPVGFQVASRMSSHGEIVKTLLSQARDAGNAIVFMDEPDMALSVRTIKEVSLLFAELADGGTQIIAAVHNPLIIASVAEVLSIEHRQWMSSTTFLDSHWPGLGTRLEQLHTSY